jgi:hypothetical protein
MGGIVGDLDDGPAVDGAVWDHLGLQRLSNKRKKLQKK